MIHALACHNAVAADLAKKSGADYVLVGRLHKPSYLFAYLMGHLIKTDTGGLIENYVVETKGGDKKLTLKAVETLASKIDDNLDKIYITPPPSRTVRDGPNCLNRHYQFISEYLSFY